MRQHCQLIGSMVVVLIILGCESKQPAAAPTAAPAAESPSASTATTAALGTATSAEVPASATTAETAASATPARDSRYPVHWWTPVSRDGAPGWEILPQEAGPGEVILSKRNELGLLSNFAPTPFEFRGKRYASMEGFWQMMKYPEGPDDARAKFEGLQWQHTRDEVAQLTSFDAKKAGDLGDDNMKTMGINWVTFEGKQMEYKPAEPGDHYRLIVEAMREKVLQNPQVQKVLLATGDLVLKPDHHQDRDAVAAWRYHEILTAIRSQLQQQSQK